MGEPTEEQLAALSAVVERKHEDSYGNRTLPDFYSIAPEAWRLVRDQVLGDDPAPYVLTREEGHVLREIFKFTSPTTAEDDEVSMAFYYAVKNCGLSEDEAETLRRKIQSGMR